MTATPTPLRELLQMLECGDLSPAEQMQLAEMLPDEAALSARQEEEAVDSELVADMLRRYSAIVTSDGFDAAGHYTENCIGEQIEALESSEAGAQTVAIATAPASGEAVTPDRDQCGHGIPANPDAIDAYMAASGEAGAAKPAIRLTIIGEFDAIQAIRKWENVGELPPGTYDLYTTAEGDEAHAPLIAMFDALSQACAVVPKGSLSSEYVRSVLDTAVAAAGSAKSRSHPLAKVTGVSEVDALLESCALGAAYSHNFANAKPDIGLFEREHILGLCAKVVQLSEVIRRLAAVAPAGMVLVTPTLLEKLVHYASGSPCFCEGNARCERCRAIAEAQAAPTPPATAGKE